MRDAAAQYAAKNVVVFGINGASAQSHDLFARRHQFTAALLSDPGLKVAERYDAVSRLGPLHLVKRTVVGINPEGTIIFYRRGMPTTEEILVGLDESGHKTGRSAAG